MNCVNHPDIPVAAYCQNCGKALCAQCVRSVSGVIYCEQCLAAKLGIGGAAYNVSGTPGGAAYAASGTAPGGVSYTVSGSTNGDLNYTVSGVQPPPISGPNPGTATLLGFIPGVGAMYNGQFVKALVHVLVFVILIGITDNHPIFGIFIAAWVFYQVFDAHHTAKARRDGLPLPDPFGLNELGPKIGIPNSPSGVPFTQTYPAPGPIPGPVPPPPPMAGFTPVADYVDPNAPYVPVPPPAIDPNLPVKRREPVGAIVLIGLGLLFLFNTLGFFRFDWMGHLWPFFIIALGVWLLINRTRGSSPPPPPPGSPIGGGQ
jgi:hypothetical protein